MDSKHTTRLRAKIQTSRLPRCPRSCRPISFSSNPHYGCKPLKSHAQAFPTSPMLLQAPRKAPTLPSPCQNGNKNAKMSPDRSPCRRPFSNQHLEDPQGSVNRKKRNQRKKKMKSMSLPHTSVHATTQNHKQNKHKNILKVEERKISISPLPPMYLSISCFLFFFFFPSLASWEEAKGEEVQQTDRGQLVWGRKILNGAWGLAAVLAAIFYVVILFVSILDFIAL